ncbi:MAG TPA: hypothetical protein VI932_06210 [Bacteroidota bacterium]|nr:hypothetical protein [Bacteroidota bacterium]
MKRPPLILLLCLILPSVLFSQTDTAAAATEEPSVSGIWVAVAAGGWTIPFEPSEFKDQFKPNFNFGGGIAYSLPPGEAGYGEVSLLFHYYNVLFSRSDFTTANNIPASATVYGYPGDIFTAMVQFRGVFAGSRDNIAPYFTTGMGFYHIALPALGIENAAAPISEEYKKSTFGWSVGLGVDVPVMDRLTFFADGKFLLGVTETNGHKLISVGGGVRVTL